MYGKRSIIHVRNTLANQINNFLQREVSLDAQDVRAKCGVRKKRFVRFTPNHPSD